MKIQRKEGYILITSAWVVATMGFVGGGSYGRQHARAAAFFPFIFVRDETQVIPWVINHERIHHRQQLEMLWIGLGILEYLEYLYALLILKKTPTEAYLWKSSEQEAYRNQHDPEYLKKRRRWAQFKYLTDKKEFGFSDTPGEIVFK